jgi:MoxR-like ATPase
MNAWPIFRAGNGPNDALLPLPDPPEWRKFDGAILRERRLPTAQESLEQNRRGAKFRIDAGLAEMVNVALVLRRPLLLTGKPGSGKSSLIYAVARALRLGEVLRWPITSRSTLKEGLYEYDAIGRLHQERFTEVRTDIGPFLRLGPLGTALLPTSRPRALLIDEIDKSDIDLPNDLLNVFEEGEFRIPELERLQEKRVLIRDVFGTEEFPIENGHVRCHEFPFIVMTSNGEREFPAPFLRRCVRYNVPQPNAEALAEIVRAHLGDAAAAAASTMITNFAEKSRNRAVATDQLLNAVYLLSEVGLMQADHAALFETITSELVASPISETGG